MPKPLPYNESRIGDQTAKESVAPGKHALVISKADKHEKEGSANFTARFTLRMLKDPNDSKSFTGPLINHFWTLPFDNPDVQGHTVFDRAGEMTCDFLSGVFPDQVFHYPRWNRDTGCFEYRGKPIEQHEEMSCREEAYKSGYEKALELWGEGGEGLTNMVGIVLFAETYNDDYGAKLTNIHSELPKDWTLSKEKVIKVTSSEAPGASAPPPPPPKKKTRRRR